jgi:hypothetical protein
VVNAGSAALKKGSDDDNLLLARNFRDRLRRWAGDGLGKVEKLGVFLAAKILSAKKFVHADDLRATHGGFANLFDRTLEILFRIRRRTHLDQADGEFVGHRKLV